MSTRTPYGITGEPFFVVGMTTEAARVADAGYHALSASELDAANVAIDLQTSPEPIGTAILLLNDAEAAVWSDALDVAGIPNVKAYSVEYIDAMRDGGGEKLSAYLARYHDAESKRLQEARMEARALQLQKLHVHDTVGIAMDIFGCSVSREYVPTGIASLDKAIGGGLPEGGLTVLAAGSSNGKTTWALQFADYVAASGRPVLFVTVEQGRHELVAKSLSRMMRQTSKHNGGYYTASAAHIMSRKHRDSWPIDKTNALLACCTAYSQNIAPSMYYFEIDGRNTDTDVETTGQPSVADIRRAYDAIGKKDGKNPVLIVDYLQLLKAKDERMTERKSIDVNVMELRQLARDMDTVVLVISSINRASYSEGADLASFKESGAIEFSADLAMMLQPRGYGEKVSSKRTEKEAKEAAREAMAQHKGKVIRDSEIVVLKNRNGQMPNKPVPLSFDAMCNLFTEGSARVPQDDDDRVL